MAITIYKLLHIAGVAGLLLSLGGICIMGLTGQEYRSSRARKLIAASHGIALALVLIAGFGMLARLQLGSPKDWGLWVWLKIIIWLAYGAALPVLARVPKASVYGWAGAWVLALAAAYLAIFKPF